MHGDIFRVQVNGRLQAMAEAFHRIPRQTRDQVHVDVIMPHAAGGPVTIQDILRRVAAANVAQHFIRECLRVDGNAGCAVFFDDAQFFFVGTVRAARFHGKLFQGGQVKLLGHGAHQLAQLLRVDAGGGAAADIQRFDAEVCGVRSGAGSGKLLAQAVHVGGHQRTAGFIPHRAGNKAAIAAAGRAERNARVHTAIHRLGALQHRALQVRNTFGHGKTARRAVKMLQKALFDFFFGFALGAQVMDDAHWAHAGHHAPGWADTGNAAQHGVQHAAQGILLRAGIPLGRALLHPGGCAVLPHQNQQQIPVSHSQHKVCGIVRQGLAQLRCRVKDACGMLGLIPSCRTAQYNLHKNPRIGGRS